MRLRMTTLVHRFRANLFFVPLVFVIAGLVLGQAMLALDSAITDSVELPVLLDSTVDNARAVLSTVATATITVAGIAFSVSLLVIQLASSQYSPRVVSSLFRDPFNKRVMGIVVGTFTYCLVVLRSVREAISDDGEPVVPTMSVSLAVVLGLVSVLAIVAFINHSAHSMDVSELLQKVTQESLSSVESNWSEPGRPTAPVLDDVPPVAGHPVRFDRNGWIQYVDDEALLALIPAGGVLRLEVTAGHFAISGTPLCSLWPAPRDDDRESVEEAVRDAVWVGESRTLQQDAGYGVRQLVDVALRALSPGVNDPTTAQDAIFHTAAVVREMLEREPPARAVEGAEGRRLLRPQVIDHAEVVELAFDEIRLASREMPTVSIYLLDALHLLCRAERPAEDPAVLVALRRQAELVVEGSAAADLLPHDLNRVRAAHAARFGPAPEG